MILVRKQGTLSGQVRRLSVGESVAAGGYRESTCRSLAATLGRETGNKYKVHIDADDICTITRVA